MSVWRWALEPGPDLGHLCVHVNTTSAEVLSHYCGYVNYFLPLHGCLCDYVVFQTIPQRTSCKIIKWKVINYS